MLGDADKHAARVRQRLRTSKPLCWLGDALRFDDRYDDAAAVYRTAVLVHPEEPEALVGLATVLYAQGDYEAAVPVFQKCLELSPDDSHLSYDLADALEMTDRLDEAIAVYERLGEDGHAIAEYTRAIELDPGNPDLYIGRARARSGLGEAENAIADYTKAIELDPDDSDLYIGRGLAYSEQGEHENAIADYTKAIELDPDDSDLYVGRARAYSGQGEYESAIADYTRAIELDPDDSDLYVGRGDAYSAQGDHENEWADYERGYGVHHSYFRGQTCVYQCEWDEAIRWFTKFIDAYAGTKTMWYALYLQRAFCWYVKGDYKRAMQDYDAAMELAPDEPDAIGPGLDLAWEMGDYGRVIDRCTRWIEVPGDTEQDHWERHMRAWAFYYTGMYQEAAQDFTWLIDRPDGDELVADELDRYRLMRGQCRREMGDLALAIQDYTVVVHTMADEGDPQELQPKALIGRARAWHALGQSECAIDDLTAAINLEADNIPAHYYRGVFLADMERLSLASADFRALCDLLEPGDLYEEVAGYLMDIEDGKNPLIEGFSTVAEMEVRQAFENMMSKPQDEEYRHKADRLCECISSLNELCDLCGDPPVFCFTDRATKSLIELPRTLAVDQPSFQAFISGLYILLYDSTGTAKEGRLWGLLDDDQRKPLSYVRILRNYQVHSEIRLKSDDALRDVGDIHRDLCKRPRPTGPGDFTRMQLELTTRLADMLELAYHEIEERQDRNGE